MVAIRSHNTARSVILGSYAPREKVQLENNNSMEVDSSLKTPTTEVTETNLQEFDTCHHHAPVQKKSCSKSMQYAKVILQCYLAALVLALTVTVIVCGIKLYNKVTALEARVQSLEGQLNRTTINPVPYSLPSRPETDDKSIVALQEEVEDLNKTLASMNESLKERFAGCYEERKSKNILPINSFKYYRGCVTEVADINMNVSPAIESVASSILHMQGSKKQEAWLMKSHILGIPHLINMDA